MSSTKNPGCMYSREYLASSPSNMVPSKPIVYGNAAATASNIAAKETLFRLGIAGELAKIPIQADIGFGDIVTPAPSRTDYPTLLEFPGPSSLAYPKETVVAEKLEALPSEVGWIDSASGRNSNWSFMVPR
jgi:hypothetical protein